MFEVFGILGDVVRIVTFQPARISGNGPPEREREWIDESYRLRESQMRWRGAGRPDIAPAQGNGHVCRMSDQEPAISPQGRLEHGLEVRTAPRGRNFSDSWRRSPGRLLGTSVVRFYQLTLSGFVGNSCRHLPTCSEYAYEAIARHGLWTGGWMGLFRLIRCGPGGTHGVDNVPLRLEPGYRWFTPWRCWRIGAGGPEAQR